MRLPWTNERRKQTLPAQSEHNAIHAESRRKAREHANVSFGFTKLLPGELRNRIYELTLPHDSIYEPIASRNWTAFQYDGRDIYAPVEIVPLDRWYLQLSFTQVSTLFRAEALDFFYGNNRFILRATQRVPWPTSLSAKWIATRPPSVFRIMQPVTLVDESRCWGVILRNESIACTLHLASLETGFQSCVGLVGYYDFRWSDAEILVDKEKWKGEIERSEEFRELASGWDTGSVTAQDVVRLITMFNFMGLGSHPW